ncbi:unnamed protein product [Diatraea saccharalis]|uniref:Uncharacterized protein n=1 Tax=Diatraea saccharalis TaxID=40085 RepID=A0A9N9R7H5_9NEOP|nr:unnamed protein product [Diatraea saccharalis]
MSSQIICGGCRVIIPDRRYLSCSGCKQCYDLVGANVSEQRFYNTLTREHRDAWKCVVCQSKQPKTDKTNTPARAADFFTVLRGAATKSPLQLDLSIVEQLESQEVLNDTHHNITIEMSDFQSFVLEMRSFRDEIREQLLNNRVYTERLNDTLVALSDRIVECENRVTKFEKKKR